MTIAAKSELGLELPQIGIGTGTINNDDRFGDVDEKEMAAIEANVREIEETWKRFLTIEYWKARPAACLLIPLLGKCTRGDPLPQESALRIRYTAGAKTLTRSTEGAVFGLLDAILWGSAVYLVSIGENPVKVIFSANQNTLLTLITAVVNSPWVRAIAAAPFIFVGGRMIVSQVTLPSSMDEYVEGYKKNIGERYKFWDHPALQFPLLVPGLGTVFRGFYALGHRGVQPLNKLSRQVHDDGRLWDDSMETCFSVIFDNALNGGGITQAAGIKHTARVAGRSIQDFDDVINDLKDSTVKEDVNKVKEYKIHRKATLNAVKVLKDVYKKLPWYNPNKLLAGFYLCQLGQNNSWRSEVLWVPILPMK